jgi:hypothetical protein
MHAHKIETRLTGPVIKKYTSGAPSQTKYHPRCALYGVTLPNTVNATPAPSIHDAALECSPTRVAGACIS